jgi:hypothetical protein
MLKALLELHAGGIEGEPEMGNSEHMDGVLEKARRIGQVIMASRPRGRQARIHVGDMAAMDGLDGSKVSERAIRMNRCSIARFGLLNPLVVRHAGRGIQLLLGHARHEACRRLGLGKVPAVVKDVEDVEAVELALLDILLGNGANHVESGCLRAVLRFYMELGRERTEAQVWPGKRQLGDGAHM